MLLLCLSWGSTSYCSLITLRMLLCPYCPIWVCAHILVLREREAFLFLKFVVSPCVLNRVYEYIWNRCPSWRIVGSLLKIILELTVSVTRIKDWNVLIFFHFMSFLNSVRDSLLILLNLGFYFVLNLKINVKLWKFTILTF